MKMTLEIEGRDGKSATVLRQNDLLPAVVYGPKQPNVGVAVNRLAFDKIFKQAGESTIITLTGLESDIEVLIHDVDFNPIKGGATHVDFYAIEKGKEITTDVPLEFIGESPIEKLGGMVNKVLHEIEVTCQPAKLPAKITIDLSVLIEADQKIHVSDLEVVKGVVINTPAEEVVAVAVAAGVREEEETTETLTEAEVLAPETNESEAK